MVIDTDGSAFITKAEFDSLKNNFQSQIDSYNSAIDSKIDGAIASYLSGIKISSTRIMSFNCSNSVNTIGIKNYRADEINYWKNEKTDYVSSAWAALRWGGITDKVWKASTYDVFPIRQQDFFNSNDEDSYTNTLLSFDEDVACECCDIYRYYMAGGGLAIWSGADTLYWMIIENLNTPRFEPNMWYTIDGSTQLDGNAFFSYHGRPGLYFYPYEESRVEGVFRLLVGDDWEEWTAYDESENVGICSHGLKVMLISKRVATNPMYYSTSGCTNRVLFQNVNSGFRLFEKSSLDASNYNNFRYKRKYKTNTIIIGGTNAYDIDPEDDTEYGIILDTVIYPPIYFESSTGTTYNSFDDEVMLKDVKCNYNFKNVGDNKNYYKVNDGIFLMNIDDKMQDVQFDVKFTNTDSAKVKFGLGVTGFDISLNNMDKLIKTTVGSDVSKTHILNSDTVYTIKINDVASLRNKDIFFSWTLDDGNPGGEINYISDATIVSE